MISYKTHLGIE